MRLPFHVLAVHAQVEGVVTDQLRALAAYFDEPYDARDPTRPLAVVRDFMVYFSGAVSARAKQALTANQALTMTPKGVRALMSECARPPSYVIPTREVHVPPRTLVISSGDLPSWQHSEYVCSFDRLSLSFRHNQHWLIEMTGVDLLRVRGDVKRRAAGKQHKQPLQKCSVANFTLARSRGTTQNSPLGSGKRRESTPGEAYLARNKQVQSAARTAIAISCAVYVYGAVYGLGKKGAIQDLCTGQARAGSRPVCIMEREKVGERKGVPTMCAQRHQPRPGAYRCAPVDTNGAATCHPTCDSAPAAPGTTLQLRLEQRSSYASTALQLHLEVHSYCASTALSLCIIAVRQRHRLSVPWLSVPRHHPVLRGQQAVFKRHIAVADAAGAAAPTKAAATPVSATGHRA
eukprot:111365-Chlamydomonas_euryale.AAC.1